MLVHGRRKAIADPMDGAIHHGRKVTDTSGACEIVLTQRDAEGLFQGQEQLERAQGIPIGDLTGAVGVCGKGAQTERTSHDLGNPTPRALRRRLRPGESNQ